jgi:hypothetical protein
MQMSAEVQATDYWFPVSTEHESVWVRNTVCIIKNSTFPCSCWNEQGLLGCHASVSVVVATEISRLEILTLADKLYAKCSQ